MYISEMTVNYKKKNLGALFNGEGDGLAGSKGRVRLAYFFLSFTWSGGIVVLTLCCH